MVKKSKGIEDPKIDVFKQLQTFSKKSVSDVAKILESDECFMGMLKTLIKNCSYFLNLKNVDSKEGKLLVENLDLVSELEKAIGEITISFDERFVTSNGSGGNRPSYAYEIKNLKINIPQNTNPNIKTIISERFSKVKGKLLEISVYDIKNLGTYSSKSNELFFNYLCNNLDFNKKLLLEFYAEKIIKVAIKKASEVLVVEDPFTIDDVRKGNAKLELISDRKIKEGLKFNYNVLGLKDFIKNEKDPKQIQRFAEIVSELLKGNA